jgi:hypothetical protein
MRSGLRTLIVFAITLLMAAPAQARGGFGRRGSGSTGGPRTGGARTGPSRTGGSTFRAGLYDPWYPYAPWGYAPYGVGTWGWYGGGAGYGGPYPSLFNRRPAMGWAPPREGEARLVFEGFATARAFHPGASVQVEAERLGLHLSVLSLAQPPTPDGYPSSVPMLALRGGWAFVHRPSLRIQGELGVRGLFGDDFVYFGPDVALSARWRFAGPFSLRSTAAVMPWPAVALTSDLAVGLQVGAGLFELGWRAVRLDDTPVNPDGGVLLFRGFLMGAGLRL